MSICYRWILTETTTGSVDHCFQHSLPQYRIQYRVDYEQANSAMAGWVEV